MKSMFLIIIILCLITCELYSQVGINTDGSQPDPSAGLDVKFINKGFLPPRLTTLQRNAISDPVAGLTIFNTDLKCLEFYTGSSDGWYCPCMSSGVIDCGNIVVNGIYLEGIPLTSSNTITLNISTTLIGGYSISTNILNGFSFSRRGTFSSTGNQTVTLASSGTPATTGTYTFTVSYGNSICYFPITVSTPIGQPCPNMPTVTDLRDGKIYNTILLGNQCWLKENLNIGTMITGSQNQTNNNIIEKYCYANNLANCNIYGGLYQWAEIVQYLNGATNITSWNPVPSGNITGICPTGWHIPSDIEWTILTTYLGGSSIAGGKMKEPGYSHWNSPNTGATNESNFTALAGGYNDGSFINLGIENWYWASTEYSSTEAWPRELNFSTTSVLRNTTNRIKIYGFNVRCLKD
jgi:uncharacterized protein (TIGR02145 family)